MSTRFSRRKALALGTAALAVGCEAAEAEKAPEPACIEAPDGPTTAGPASVSSVEEIATWMLAVDEEVLVRELRQRTASDWSLDSVYAALVLVGARNIDSLHGGGGFHRVIQVPVLRTMAARAPEAEALIPLVYGMLLTRGSAANTTWQLPTFDLSSLPTSDGADERLVAAVEADQLEDAFLEVTALAEMGNVAMLHDVLLELGSRRAHKLGHEAICAAKLVELTGDLPGRWSDDVLRAIVYAVMTKDAPRGPEYTEVWQANRAKASSRPELLGGTDDDPSRIAGIASRLLEAPLPLDAVAIVEAELDSGLSTLTCWDALIVAAADSVWRGGNYHAFTSAQALRDAFGLATSDSARLLMLLQGAAFTPVHNAAPGVGKSLSDADPTPGDLEAIFSRDGHLSIELALGYFNSGGDSQAYAEQLESLARSRATDEHHYKLAHAALIEAARLPCEYRGHALAITRRYAPTSNLEVNRAFTLVDKDASRIG